MAGPRYLTKPELKQRLEEVAAEQRDASPSLQWPSWYANLGVLLANWAKADKVRRKEVDQLKLATRAPWAPKCKYEYNVRDVRHVLRARYRLEV